MNRFLWTVAAIGLFACLLAVPAATEAALTPAQRTQLGEISKDLINVPRLITRKDFDEANKILTDATKKFEAIEKGNENDPLVVRTKRTIALQQTNLQKAQNGGQAGVAAINEVSFTKEVAPLLISKCGTCHVNRGSGGLQFDTFANLMTGGNGGAPIVAGNAQQSLLLQRLVNPQRRMPQNAAPLAQNELTLIANWIAQGAKFDGGDRTDRIGTPARNAANENVAIPKPSGTETVSFIRDVAPFMVNLCTGCHGQNNPRADFSLVSFESLMKGGQSGRVLIPGNLEGSRLFRLVGGLENPRMPQGQARITRKNYEDLKKWIEEGCKFDGTDPKLALRRQVPTEEELTTERLAKLTPEQFNEYRLKRSDEQWDSALANERPRYVESKEVIVYGNANAERLTQIDKWAEEHIKTLRDSFGVKSDQVWKGRLTVFVFKDRFGYEEFNQIVHSRQTPQEVMGHSQVVPNMEDAFIALQDIGDEPSAQVPGMRVSVIDHITGAFLQRSGTGLPDWLIRGTGLAMAAKVDTENVYINGLRSDVPSMLSSLSKPDDVFANGTFSPSSVGAVGYTLVDFMMKQGGVPNFGKFVQSLQGGGNVQAGLRSVYQSDMPTVAAAYVASLSTAKK